MTLGWGCMTPTIGSSGAPPPSFTFLVSTGASFALRGVRLPECAAAARRVERQRAVQLFHTAQDLGALRGTGVRRWTEALQQATERLAQHDSVLKRHVGERLDDLERRDLSRSAVDIDRPERPCRVIGHKTG